MRGNRSRSSRLPSRLVLRAPTGRRPAHGTTEEGSVFQTALFAGAASRSRGAVRPSFANFPYPPITRGAGKAGRRLHPWVPCKKARGRTQVQPDQPPSCAMVYGLLRDLPGDRLSCHRHLADTSAKLSASVGAPGPHDFAVRKTPLVRAKNCAVVLRPSHPAPRRDDRDTPLLVARDAEL